MSYPIIEDESLIEYVNRMIEHAIQQAASDIHIEPNSTYCRIRHRRDGLLYEIAQIKLELAARMIMRLKVMAKLDITEQRIPQDGRLQLFGIDIRINTCPLLQGEKIVLRILDHQNALLQIHSLGFNTEQMQLFIDHITKPHGLILVTGPTGCGKSMTLYAALNHLNTTERNIITAEDPVEIQLTGINQVNIQPKLGLDYATLLRTFLRQDPDIIMIGEIRDAETARISMQAATTGHLVLTTLHTNSALETLSRLESLGLTHYHIAHSLSLIIAQRLVRKLCNQCKKPDPRSDDILKNLAINLKPPSTLFQATGCKYCLHGYIGRIAIYEMLPITDALATIQPLTSLQQSGIEKVLDGSTSLTELNRVLFA